MTTHFISAEVSLEQSPAKLHQNIETELQKHGEPLRWAITKINKEQQSAQVEAVVTK